MAEKLERGGLLWLVWWCTQTLPTLTSTTTLGVNVTLLPMESYTRSNHSMPPKADSFTLNQVKTTSVELQPLLYMTAVRRTGVPTDSVQTDPLRPPLIRACFRTVLAHNRLSYFHLLSSTVFTTLFHVSLVETQVQMKEVIH